MLRRTRRGRQRAVRRRLHQRHASRVRRDLGEARGETRGPPKIEWSQNDVHFYGKMRSVFNGTLLECCALI